MLFLSLTVRALLVPVLILSLPPFTAAVEVTVEIDGLTSREGQVVVHVYADRDTFLQRPSSLIAVPLAEQPPDGPVRVALVLPDRPVAICAYHDRNADGQIDRSLVGVPREPYAWSRGIHPKWMPPSWDEVVIAGGADGPRPVGQDPDARSGGTILLRLRDW